MGSVQPLLLVLQYRSGHICVSWDKRESPMHQCNSQCTRSHSELKVHFVSCVKAIFIILGKELTQGGGCLPAPWEGMCLSLYTPALCGSPVKCWIGS